MAVQPCRRENTREPTKGLMRKSLVFPKWILFSRNIRKKPFPEGIFPLPDPQGSARLLLTVQVLASPLFPGHSWIPKWRSDRLR